MVNYQFDNPDADNNRIAAVPKVAFEKATLLALDVTGEFVLADAADGVQGQAVAMAAQDAYDLSSLDGNVAEEFLKNKMTEEKSVLVGEGQRAGGFRNDILVTDRDGLDAFTPGQPVYLASGGGVTQTKPATTGNAVQIVGIAQDANSFMLDIQTTDVTA